MYAGGVLKRVNGLTYDKLIYFVRAGYVEPKKVKKRGLYYNDFSEEDVELIKRAWTSISKYDVAARKAFERTRDKGKEPQLMLNLKSRSNNSS
jgi:hypothetical protein